MNSGGFISFKLGQQIIFQHPLSQLKQIASTMNKRNINQNLNQNQRKNYNLDVIPKFIQTQNLKQIHLDLSKKIINKKNIFNKIKTTYFSKNHPDFSENLKKMENEMNFLEESINKNNTIDYTKFGEMINIINNNKTNEKIKSFQKMNIQNYENINDETKIEILNSINLNKQIFNHILGLNKFNQKLYQSIKCSKALKSKKDSKKNKNIFEINENNNNNKTNNNIIIEKSNDLINDDKNIKKETNINDNETKAIIPVTDEQINLFKSFVGNNKLSNQIIISYFDMYNPKVKMAAENYFKSRYGSEFISLNFIYPIKGAKQHKFKLISEIKDLFFTAQNDLSTMAPPKLFFENGKELMNNRKIKCIGALNLNNNSVIKVFKN